MASILNGMKHLRVYTGVHTDFTSFVFLLGLTLIDPSFIQDSKKDYLNAHNAARAERIGDCNLVHSSMQEYGENHAWSSADLSSMETVKMWVDEKANYDYKSNFGGLEQLSLCRMC
ncbi:pathogenesis-related protein 1 [Quercus suber]|uniref:Pathogenesis-related protein 1 n=1 Tax=Quercus suber TaxID=58331 RepID=A0AAW0JYX0_QUESU